MEVRVAFVKPLTLKAVQQFTYGISKRQECKMRKQQAILNSVWQLRANIHLFGNYL